MHDIPRWLRERSLPDGISLEVLRDGMVVFTSTGKWLHPLLELERFLRESQLQAADLFIHDTIVGRAAAALMVRMGFRTVKSRMMSTCAVDLFELHSTAYCYDVLVEKIACRTEDLITPGMDPEAIYQMVLERAQAAGTAASIGGKS
ncbi:MAG: hypothetical protein CVV52_07580 [Spirochaetae bacterium HGW-Spirochaetae-8]|nr:MAG: hypothetical protein CVV52_07580 [Spirochaetae bacterium HGW-Spirochaetae-8]